MIQSHTGGVGKIFAVFVLISSHTPAAFVLRNFTKLTWRTGAEDVSRRRLIIPERAKLARIWSLLNGIASIVLHKLTILISQVPSAQNPAAQDDSRNGSRQWWGSVLAYQKSQRPIFDFLLASILDGRGSLARRCDWQSTSCWITVCF
jgi:hypothetical protein